MNKRKKILQINSVAGLGSTGRIADTLGDLALDHGFESYIAYGRQAAPSRSQLLKIGNRADTYAHVAQSRLFDNHAFGSLRATRRFVAQIREIGPDLVHLHNIHGYYLHAGELFEYLAGQDIPIVWTLHDCWPLTGHCAHFSYTGCEKWRTGCFNCPASRHYPSARLLDRSKRNYERKKALFTAPHNLTVVAVSQWLAGIVRDSFLGGYPVEVICNGVNTALFRPQEELRDATRARYGLGGRYLLVAAATAWSARKGLNDYAALRQQLPEEFDILLIGLTPQQIAELPPGIRGIARTNNAEELARLYAAADIVLNLSREESFGLTTAEGFACGTPGIVLDATASPELITPQTGIVVPPDDPAAIAAAVRKITTRGRAFYAEACRNRALQYYDKNRQWAKYIDLYDRLLTTK